MNKRNNSGPSTDPWGTPLVIVRLSDFKPERDTYCSLFDKYDLKKFSSISLIP